MRRRTVNAIVVLVVVGLLFSGPLYSFGSGAVSSDGRSLATVIPDSGITIYSNGTVVVSGNSNLTGGHYSSQYDGHGAMFVSGNFIVQSSAVLHLSGLSIVFVKNASLINHGKVFANDSIITVYNLSIEGVPTLSFENYGVFMGNNTSLEFRGSFDAVSSTVTVTGGYIGRGALSFSISLVGSVMVLSEDKVYGGQMLGVADALGYGDLVDMNVSGSTVYAYNTFFNLAPPRRLTSEAPASTNNTTNGTTSYSSTTGKYSGGYINLASSSLYLLNFSMDFNASDYGLSGFVFPMFGDALSSAYFFDGETISVVSASGYPVYDASYSLTEGYSPYVGALNEVFRNISYSREYAPFPEFIGPVTTLYGLADVYNGTGLYTFNYYTLTVMQDLFTVQFPALPVFHGNAETVSVDVPTVYLQLSPLNLTYSVSSRVALNYSVLYGNINGQVVAKLNGSTVYTHYLSAVAGSMGGFVFDVRPSILPGSYFFNVSFIGGSNYSYNALDVPTTVHQDMAVNISISPSYTVVGEAPSYYTVANVSVRVDATGNFQPTYGNASFAIFNGSGYFNQSARIALSAGSVEVLIFSVPSSMLSSHVMLYSFSLSPGSKYTQRSVYKSVLNQLLTASILKVQYKVVSGGIGSVELNLSVKVSSLIAENNYSLYSNGATFASGYAAPGWLNFTVPGSVGGNSVKLELNDEPLTNTNTSTSWNLTYYVYNVALNGQIPQYMTYGYPPTMHLNVSAVGASSDSSLSLYLNGTQYPLNGSAITVRAVSNVNVVTVYENIAGFEVLMAEHVFTSQVVYPPAVAITNETSLVGIFHTAVSIKVPSGVSFTNATMVGVGTAYNSTFGNGIATFYFYSDFRSSGVVNGVMTINGIVHGLPFTVNVTLSIKVGYPAVVVDYASSHLVEYGTSSVVLREVNLNHTGVYVPVTVVVTNGQFSRSYTLTPNSNGEIAVPLQGGLGIYSIELKYPTGFAESIQALHNVVRVSLFALPLWMLGIIVAVIGGVGGMVGYRKVAPTLKKKNVRRMVTCNNCKREVPYDADKCPYCGKRFSDRMVCDDCGAEIPRTSDFCVYCGNVFNTELKMAEWLKKKYRRHVQESKKELEKVIGNISDSDFWRLIIQGSKTVDVETFEVFRNRYIFSGNFSEKGTALCPVCGNGIVLTDDECPVCHVKMYAVLAYFARVRDDQLNRKGRNSVTRKKKVKDGKAKKVDKPKKESRFRRRKKDGD